MIYKNLQILRQNAVQTLLKAGIEPQEAKIEVDMLLEYVYGLSKKDILLNDKEISDSSEFDALISRRISEKIPVQYLINRAYFMGDEFYVDENVLIPRPETELLVETVIRHCVQCLSPSEEIINEGISRLPSLARDDDSIIKIIDIGTGSGCIAIMLAKMLPNAQIIAVDISEKALSVARNNAQKLGVSERITFVQSDIFENIEGKVDVIVSNPPYIPLKDKDSLQIEVQKHEPHLALFVEDNLGVSFYEKLAEQATQRLNKGGILAVEIGFSQGDSVKKIFEKNRFKDIEIIKDMSGIERVIISISDQ